MQKKCFILCNLFNKLKQLLWNKYDDITAASNGKFTLTSALLYYLQNEAGVQNR